MRRTRIDCSFIKNYNPIIKDYNSLGIRKRNPDGSNYYKERVKVKLSTGDYMTLNLKYIYDKTSISRYRENLENTINGILNYSLKLNKSKRIDNNISGDMEYNVIITEILEIWTTIESEVSKND